MLTLNEWATTFLKLVWPEIGIGHYRNYTITIRLLTDFIGADRPLDQIRPADADDFRASLFANGYAEATVAGHIRNARAMFKRALRREHIERSPFDVIPAGSYHFDRAPVQLTSEDIAALVTHAPSPGWAMWIGLCSLAGLRRAEATRVRWGDIDTAAGKLFVRNIGKRNKVAKPREVRLEPELARMIEQYKHHDEFLVNCPTSNAHRVMDRIYREAKVKKQTGMLFKELRRWRGATWKEDHPVYIVDAWLGHSLAVSREHYVPIPECHYTPMGGRTSENASNQCDLRAAHIKLKINSIACDLRI